MIVVAMANFASDGTSGDDPRASSRVKASELDAATLERCRKGDRMAFRAFVVRYERMVFALLSRMTGRGSHVEDLAQEVFLRAFRALPNFDPEGAAKVSTWLLTIATRLALDAKKRRTIPTVDLDAGADVAHGPTPEAHARTRELGRAIERAANALPDDQRAAFVLAEFHGMGSKEIAGVLDIPEATAKTRLFRARERMRESLAAAWEER